MPRTSFGFARSGIAAALLGILASAGFLAAGCGDDDDPVQPAVQPFFPRTVLADYVEVRDCRNSIDHAGQVRVYANPGAATDYVEGNYPLAEGSVIVKPRWIGLDCEGPPNGYVAMRKVAAGTSPETGDWEWQTVSADFKVTQSGFLRNECAGCHSACAETDYLCTEP